MTFPLVVVSPLPPVKNGIADYTAELLAHHAADFKTYVVVADEQPEPDTGDLPITVLRASEVLRSEQFRDARFLYHIGNNPDHAYMLPLIAKYPGVVVLHDFGLSYLLEMASFPKGDRDTYRAWAQHDHGSFGGKLADDFLTKGWRGRFMQSVLTLNGAILARATALVVHSRYSQFKAAASRPGLPVHYLPHHVSEQVGAAAGVSRTVAREQLGLPQEPVLITALGFITRPKMIDKVLASLARLQDRLPDFRLVLAGERRPHEYDVDADVLRSGLARQVIATDYLSEDDFFLHLAATDIVINMRYPSGGESSGTLTRAMGFGRACVVLDHGPMGEMPPTVVAKVAFGAEMEASLDRTLLSLISNPVLRERLGASAKAMTSHWTPAASAQRYREILEATPVRRPVRPAAPPVALGRRAARVARTVEGCLARALEVPSHWWRFGAVASWDTATERRLLCLDGAPGVEGVLTDLFGWPKAAITTARVADLSEPGAIEGTFDAVVCVVSSEIGVQGTDALCFALAPYLRRGASVTLEIVGPMSASAKASSSADVVLERLGCSFVRMFTDEEMAPEFESQTDDWDAPPRQVATGLKTSEFIVTTQRRDSVPSTVQRITPSDGSWILESVQAKGQ